MLIDELNSARLTKPFEALGLQPNPNGKGYLMRAWLPGAKTCRVLTLKGKKDLGELNVVNPDGLFEKVFEDVEAPFHYLYQVAYDDATVEVVDPYQFREEAFYGLNTMYETPENIYKTLGAQLVEIEVDGVKVRGTKFAVYAPSATSVAVIGDFNFWDGRRHPMARSLLGHWGYYLFQVLRLVSAISLKSRITTAIVSLTRLTLWASSTSNILPLPPLFPTRLLISGMTKLGVRLSKMTSSSSLCPFMRCT